MTTRPTTRRSMTVCSARVTTHSANQAGDGVSGNVPPPHNTGGEAAGADPSMEGILASIRRLLNEDETPPATPTGADVLPPLEQGVTSVAPEIAAAEGPGGDNGV